MRRLLRFESRHEQPLERRAFLLRAALFFALGTALVGGSLGVGMLGYSHYEGLAWRDAFLNAAMLLGGMGPVEEPRSPGGKLFAGAYALYAGLVFLVAVGVTLAPVLHRALHSFHLESDGESTGEDDRAA